MIAWIVSSSVLILAVFGLRLLFRGKISQRMIYGLWALALLRLLIPGSLAQSAVSVVNLISELTAPPVFTAPVLEYDAALDQVLEAHQFEAQYYEVLPEPAQQPYRQEAEALVEVSRQEAQVQIEAQETRYLNIRSLLIGLWIAGGGLTALALLGTNLRFAMALRRTRTRLAANCPLAVYRSPVLQTPCLFGRSIYLPTDSKPEDLTYILAHEQTHYRHGDPVWSVLRCLCLALHWYNPLVWVAAKLSKVDSELACDEATLERLGEGDREAYGKVLIEMSRGKGSVENLLVTATTMTGDKQTLYARVKAIARKPKVLIWAVAVMLVIAAVVVGCTFTGAAKDPEPTEPAETTEATETTAATLPLPKALEGVPILDKLPWKFAGSSGVDMPYQEYFEKERTYSDYRYFTNIVLAGDGYYSLVTVEDWLCIQFVTQDSQQMVGVVSRESYPGLVALGTDRYWFYCVSENTIFRMDIQGNVETIYTDDYGCLQLTDPTQFYAVSPDRMVMAFAAGHQNGYGVYRVYMGSGSVDLITESETCPTSISLRSNYEVACVANGENANFRCIPDGIIPHVTPTQPTEATITPPPETIPPADVDVPVVMAMDMLYVLDPEAQDPVTRLPEDYYFLSGTYYNYNNEVPAGNGYGLNLADSTELYASMENPDYIYYLGEAGYYRMIRAALTEEYKNLKGAEHPVPEDMALAFFSMLLRNSNYPYNQSFDMAFDSPAEVNLYYLFYKGFPEWDQRVVPLTEKEKDFLYANGWDDGLRMPIGNAERFPLEAMDARLRRFFGISLEDTKGVGLELYDHYLNSTECFYHWRSDARGFPITVLSIRETQKGTYEITCIYDTYTKEKSTITLKASENIFLIVSNVPAE